MNDGAGIYLPSFWSEFVLSPWGHLQMRVSNNFNCFNTMPALNAYLASCTGGDTICEIVGGEARTTRILIRLNDPRVSTGLNFDLVADINLTDKREQEAFWKYRRQRRPTVCIMAPMCRSFGGSLRMHKHLHYETWKFHHDHLGELLARFPEW